MFYHGICIFSYNYIFLFHDLSCVRLHYFCGVLIGAKEFVKVLFIIELISSIF